MRRNRLGGRSQPGANLLFRLLFCWLLMGVTASVLILIGEWLGVREHSGFMALLFIVVVSFLFYMVRTLKGVEGCLPGVFRLIFLVQSIVFSVWVALCLIDLFFGGKGAIFSALGLSVS